MHNILKGFRNAKAEKYELPDTAAIELEDFSLPEEPLEHAGDVEISEDWESPPVRSTSDTPIHYAQLQAELILKQAREDAERILEQAREDVRQEAEEVYAGARDEGYREGYAQGIAKAIEDSIRDRETVAARLEQEVGHFLEKATLAREEMILQTQGELLDLCIAVAEKVVRVSLKSSSQVMARMIQSATERMKRQEWVHIYISGCDTRGIAQIAPALTGALGALSQHIKIIPMGDDEGGTCIVETPEEIIDASVSTQLSNIRDILSDRMGG